MKRALPERPQSVGEEIANAVSHGVGLLLAVVGALILMSVNVRRGAAQQSIKCAAAR